MERKLGENYRYQCQASQDVAPSLAGCTLKKGGCPTLGNMEIQWVVLSSRDFPSGAVVRNSPANAGDTRDTGLIPGLGRSLGVGNGNPLQYSCPGNIWVRRISWSRKRQPTPIFLPRKYNGQRTLVSYSPRGPKSWTQWNTQTSV